MPGMPGPAAVCRVRCSLRNAAVRHPGPPGPGEMPPQTLNPHISPTGTDRSIACGGIARPPHRGPRSTARSIGSVQPRVRDPSGGVCPPAQAAAAPGAGGPRCRAPLPCLNTHLSSKTQNSVSLKRWRASAPGAAMLALPCPSPGEPRVAAPGRRWRVPGCPPAVPECPPAVPECSPAVPGRALPAGALRGRVRPAGRCQCPLSVSSQEGPCQPRRCCKEPPALFPKRSWFWWPFSDSLGTWGAAGCWEGEWQHSDTPEEGSLSLPNTSHPNTLFILCR